MSLENEISESLEKLCGEDEIYNLYTEERLAMCFADVASEVHQLQKTKSPKKLIEDISSELTEMLRGEEESLNVLMKIILPVFYKLSKDEDAKKHATRLLTLISLRE